MSEGNSPKCSFCGGPIQHRAVVDEHDHEFCSDGCLSVSRKLDAGDPTEADRHDDPPQNDEEHEPPPGEEYQQAFLRVDGMHTATCEAFLERRAENREGVIDAEASYITETVRVTFAPTRITESEIRDVLTTVGYTAALREDAPIDSNAAAERGDRRFDSALGLRYAVGVLFGSFLMLTYAVLMYPGYLSEILGEGTLDMFAGRTGFGSGGGFLILPLYLVLAGVVVVFTGLPLLRGAYVSLKMRQPTTELLVSITIVAAYLHGTVAVLLQRSNVYFDLTIVIAVVVVAAIFYESLIKRRAVKQLADITISQVEEAHVYQSDGTTETVPVEDVSVGDRVLVREGDRVPVDGVLTEDTCTVDEAIVTGESLPVRKEPGDRLIGGSIVTDGSPIIEVDESTESGIDRLVSTVWDLQSADHGTQRRANRIAKLAIPLVAGGGIVAGITTVVTTGDPATAGLALLIGVLVSCPWALGFATPLSTACSLAEALRRSIVIFDETIFERLRDIDTVVFDKTGTLTTGEMTVIEADAPDDLLETAAALERRASHPVANAIVARFGDSNSEDEVVRTDGGTDTQHCGTSSPRITEFTNYGTGVGGTVEGVQILIGNQSLFEERKWSVPDEIIDRVRAARQFGRLPIIVGRDGTAEGLIVMGDEPREQWDETVTELSDMGIEIIVLTGDDEAAAEYFGEHPSVDHVFAGVPPTGKTATIDHLQADRYVTMVGDGTNDAPALAKANLGIALGRGTAIASDAADIAIVDDDLSAVQTAFDLAEAARLRLTQTYGLSVLYNLITVPLASIGLLNPLFAMGAILLTTGSIILVSSWDLLNE